ncbi:D-inositol 3-phosphate glycosyltransferase [Luteitalea pratensis]|uniref:D-inositol 3-phosphate glycosyltransferase n=1 Tax=Luteitalea pratensis TaxID=1855912 RepID=A0A143PQG3_LUTPR|nr:glycosyltransferase family 1 protein [Luteitalea pratensis]AMY10383.1 D-inositol 3-phosphate glycosyltransferase [Luteitalea pratensis]
MKVAIDARAYFQRTGIGRYTRGLLQALAARPAGHEFLALLSDRHRPEELALGPHVTAQCSLARWLSADERAVLEREARAWGADLLHAVFPPLTAPSLPTIVTLFDITPVSLPHMHQPVVREAFERGWADIVRHGTPLVAVSNATRDAAIAAGAAPSQTAVIGIGLSSPFDAYPPVGADADARAGVLCVGTLEPRKNIPLVIEATLALGERGVATTLTIVGKTGWGEVPIAAQATASGRVYLTGFVDDADLLVLYRRAAILACPSTEEGFGLPVLEAMAQGALPLVSRAAALQETVGDPALVVNNSRDAWVETLAHWLARPAERAAKTSELVEAAHARRWEAIADAWITRYHEVAR